MPIALLGIAAFLVGMALGLFFRVFILIPAIVVSVTAIIAFSLQFSMTYGAIILVAAMAVAALQMGYLAGASIAVLTTKSKARKNRSPAAGFFSPSTMEQKRYCPSATCPMSWPKLRMLSVGLKP